jgi:long-chain acyl-CoA synthetase
VLPLARCVARVRVEGVEHLAGLEGPVVFAANHQSHLDTPSILVALPARWRARVAVAMAKEFFEAHFHPVGHSRVERFRSTSLYVLAAFFFNAFPLPQRESGARRTLRYIGDLLGDGWSVLIYPEGERTETGAIGRFRAGVGMVGSRLRVPVVPVRLDGLDRVLHKSWRRPHPGPVRVAFGAPLELTGDDYQALARQVEDAVRRI